ncbi:MAG: hypothetical protein ACOY82_02920 [Pseudomonadota bacterium]
MTSKTISTLSLRPGLRVAALTLALSLPLAACDRAPAPAPEGDAVPQAARPAASSAPAAVAELLMPAQTQTSPPADSAALAAAFGQPDDGSVERTLPDARQAGFWHGYAYRTGEEERYTAFVHAVAPAEGGLASPGQQVDLVQITYVLRDGAWQPAAPQTDVGRFGGAGRAPTFDEARIPLAYTVSADEALLALPSSMVATGGARVDAYEIFLYAPGTGAWRHAGVVRAGVDQSAGCDAGSETPDTRCVRNTGGLRFSSSAAGNRPDIQVTFSGSVRGEDGAIRAAGPADAVTYRYDTDTGIYTETPAR